MTARTERVFAADDRLRRRGVTRREAQVLRLLVQPLANASIADRLGISKRTVESHVSALLRKFAVADRTALIRAGAPAIRAFPARAATPEGRPDQHSGALVASTDSRRRIASLRQRAAVASALRTQRESIRLHDLAAVRLDTLADDWERRARGTVDSDARVRALRSAETARWRAQAARRRAASERLRVQAKGFD
jgi:DNA-binding CsgD family transcriptional regulator